MKKPVRLFWGICLACGLVTSAAAALQDLHPASDAEVIEILPARISVTPATPQAAAVAARRWITLARETADPRYLGRAQAVLAVWWGKPDAPAELAVLQATVEQSRHEFDAARKTLQRALQADPAQVQGWLTLATLERVAARYPASESACRNVARHGAALYATACLLESRSLQGHSDAARSGFSALIQQAREPADRAWLQSLLAESEERAGRDDAADAAYRASLAAAPDGYTALAYADLLLRLGRPADAVEALKAQPASDAVLLRRAHALRLMGNTVQAQALSTELEARFAALAARGEALDAHARERSLLALWLQGQPQDAWRAAQSNLALQKEPLDWWLALQTSEQSGDAAAHRKVVQAFQGTGLQDARLARWQARGSNK
ncbi:hypothetical protein [Acidovorax sp. LjRoot117]|uniref:hypothetical protein n=1 Tax=Acidovorax sp. LjRoot117 TaxID=3342255 RepID=UPI003ECC5F8E